MSVVIPFFVLMGMLVLVGCEPMSTPMNVAETKNTSEEISEFVRSVKDNLIFVEGGEFLMGDYGIQHGPERLPYDLDKDSKPLHEVKLTAYSVAKFKISNREYQFYLKANGISLRQDVDEDYRLTSMAANNPAHLDWFEAEKYCNWLAVVSHLPFSLPTEAQWEYAARSGGQFLMVATDDGTYRVTDDEVTEEWREGPRGINISTSWDRKAFAEEMGWKTRMFTSLPVDRFPPNPLGLYAMSDNGLEWVKDWYDPDYYKYSPIQDPQGPEHPVFKGFDNKHAKVLRGVGFSDYLLGSGVNVQRSYRSPDGKIYGPASKENILVIVDKTARCAVNHPDPID